MGSLKKKFAGQEVESLRVRTRQGRGPSGTPPCECLVALQPGGSGGVLGCIDLRLPASAASVHPEGVPPGDASGAYLLNVVVAADQRRRGIGRWLMLEGMARAVQVWKAQRLYTHVEADNEAAYQLYAACGFCEQAEEAAAVEGATRLGRLILLVAHASAVRPQAVS